MNEQQRLCILKAINYAKVWAETRRTFDLLGLSADERAALEGTTAARVYRMVGES